MGDNLMQQQFPASIDVQSAALSIFDIMSSKTSDAFANRAFAIPAPLRSDAGAE